MKLGDKLRLLRDDKNVTQKTVSDAIGVSERVYGYYESNERFPKDEKVLSRIADYFNVSVDYLIGKTDIKNPVNQLVQKFGRVNRLKSRTKTIPILGTFRAGIPLLSVENYIGEVEVPADQKADFALRVTGDSMSWVGIHKGDIAILRRLTAPTHGIIVAAGIEDVTWDATLKFYIKEGGKKLLRAANPEYEDIIITERHRIIGHVVSIQKEPPSLHDYRKILAHKEVSDVRWAEAIEIATGYGFDGDKIKKMIELYASMFKQL